MIIRNEPIEAYHANPAVSHSKLEVYRRCPLLYRKMFIEHSVERREETDSTRIGSAVHCLILEGEVAYARRYITVPEDSPRRPDKRQALAKKPSEATKEAIVWWQTWDAAHGHKTELACEEEGLVRRCAQAVKESPLVQEYLYGLTTCETELTLRLPYHPKFDLQCRLDILDSDHTIADLKTVKDLESFQSNYARFGYHRQAAFYRSVAQAEEIPEATFYFVVVETNEPYRVAIYYPNENDLLIGQAENTADLLKMRQSYADNSWPGSPSELEEIKLPSWYCNKLRSAE